MLIKSDAVDFDGLDLRKLQSQLLDIQSSAATKFRSDNIKKLYRLTSPPTAQLAPPTPHGAAPSVLDKGVWSDPTSFSCSDPESLAYHKQFNSTLQAFRVRKWRPLTPEQRPAEAAQTRCRPFRARPLSCQSTRLVTPPVYRPMSGQLIRTDVEFEGGPNIYRLARPDTPRVDPGRFDTLSPSILSQLITDIRPQTPNSTYGDNIDSLVIDGKSVKKLNRKKMTRRDLSTGAISPAQQSGLGELAERDAFDLLEENDETITSDDEDSDDDDDDDSSDDESISELEKGNEPPVDYNCKVPDLHLRPERLDHVYTPENKRDLRRFDFNAENVDIPLYEFDCPVPAPFTRINFRFHAREGSDWRQMIPQLGPVDPELSAMFDRLQEMESRQIETEEWEEKRSRQVRKRHSRAASAKLSGSTREKFRCCSGCLQPACVGDCPIKRAYTPNCCEHCRQPFCTGCCTEHKYDQRMRLPRQDTTAGPPPKPALPRNCPTCQKKHTAKFINANNVVLGRPTSAYTTYSRGKHSAKPKDLRPRSAADASEHITKGIEKLGIDPMQPVPPSGQKPPRPRSRSGMIPGKTYFSNLSRSLTDLSKKRRKGSAKGRKARTPVA